MTEYFVNDLLNITDNYIQIKYSYCEKDIFKILDPEGTSHFIIPTDSCYLKIYKGQYLQVKFDSDFNNEFYEFYFDIRYYKYVQEAVSWLMGHR